MNGQERLFRPEFRPVVQLNEIVALRGITGFITDDSDHPFYMVTSIRTAPLHGRRGTIVVWSATSSPAAPYLADRSSGPGSMGVSIPAGGNLDIPVDFLTLKKRQFGQARFLHTAVPDSAAALPPGVIEDYDIRVTAPPTSSRWSTERVIGVSNAMVQGHLPNNHTAAGAQGVNLADAAQLNDSDPMTLAVRSELIFYGDQGGSVNIANNGAASATTGAIGVILGLYVFNLVPLPSVGLQPDWLMGYSVAVPAKVREYGGLSQVIVLEAAGEMLPVGVG